MNQDSVQHSNHSRKQTPAFRWATQFGPATCNFIALINTCRPFRMANLGVGIDCINDLREGTEDGRFTHSIATTLVNILPACKSTQRHHHLSLRIEVILSSPLCIFWFKIIPDEANKLPK